MAFLLALSGVGLFFLSTGPNGGILFIFGLVILIGCVVAALLATSSEDNEQRLLDMEEKIRVLEEALKREKPISSKETENQDQDLDRVKGVVKKIKSQDEVEN